MTILVPKKKKKKKKKKTRKRGRGQNRGALRAPFLSINPPPISKILDPPLSPPYPGYAIGL